MTHQQTCTAVRKKATEGGRPSGGLVPKAEEHQPESGSTPKAKKNIATAQNFSATSAGATASKVVSKGPRRGSKD